LVVSFSDADFSALEKEVVVPVDLSEEDLATDWFAAAMPWRRDVSTRIGLLTPSTIRPHTFSPVLFIDAMNVIGSRPDGWWRDREGAMRRLVDELRDWATEDVTLVLDSGPDDLIGTVGHVTVVRAQRKGRNAADDEIARLVQAGDTVVTSDAALADRVRAAGAAVEGAGGFRRRLASPR
jgi:hypothetical protein